MSGLQGHDPGGKEKEESHGWVSGGWRLDVIPGKVPGPAASMGVCVCGVDACVSVCGMCGYVSVVHTYLCVVGTLSVLS